MHDEKYRRVTKVAAILAKLLLHKHKSREKRALDYQLCSLRRRVNNKKKDTSYTYFLAALIYTYREKYYQSCSIYKFSARVEWLKTNATEICFKLRQMFFEKILLDERWTVCLVGNRDNEFRRLQRANARAKVAEITRRFREKSMRRWCNIDKTIARSAIISRVHFNRERE